MITLLTDFGTNSIYIPQSKAWFKHWRPQIELIDLAHNIHPCDINEAAYVMGLMIDHFPPETIHLAVIDFDNRHEHREIVHIRFRDQHIISYNSGLLSVLSKNDENLRIHEIGQYSGSHFSAITEAFGKTALELSDNPKYDQHFSITDKANIKTALKPVIQQDGIHGHLMYFDSLGTGYTNIHKDDFDTFAGSNGFEIVLSRHERIDRISEGVEPLEGGMTTCFFNTAGYLTISVHRGRASQMYGLRKGQNIIVEKK